MMFAGLCFIMMAMRLFASSVGLVCGLAALTACSAAPAVPASLAGPDSSGSRRAATATPISHVVIIVQENRSFDNIFAGFPRADAPTTGKLSDGSVVPLEAVPFNTRDIEHSFGESLADIDGGKMDGFDKNYAYGSGGQVGRLAVSHLERKLVQPYWTMASQYTLADRMFPTQHGPSWTAHIDLVSGTTNLSPNAALINFPWHSPYNCWAPAGTTTQTIDKQGSFGSGPFPCFTQFRTMADTLDAAKVSWRFYAPPVFNDSSCPSCGYTWSAFSEIARVRNGPDWHNVISPSPRIFTDIAKGELAGVTWVVPDEGYSDHPDVNATSMGPSWVADVVDAIGTSKYWDSTAIVVVWDEWGGFYDDVVPPQLDFKGLGIRVGCIIVSPYALRHHVSHTQYEFGSVLRFVEEVFNLPPLGAQAAGYSDRRSPSISDSFDFTQTPVSFTPIAAPYPPSSFLKRPPSGRPPDPE